MIYKKFTKNIPAHETIVLQVYIKVSTTLVVKSYRLLQFIGKVYVAEDSVNGSHVKRYTHIVLSMLNKKTNVQLMSL